MSIRRNWLAWGRVPIVRTCLFVLGILMILVSPLVGAIPGPGGLIVFAFGLGLVLKYSEWAKRQYVKFKRSHPNKGRWADWGMRRRSALRREARLKEGQETGIPSPATTADKRRAAEPATRSRPNDTKAEKPIREGRWWD